MDPITKLLTRGVDTIYPTREALEKVLRSGKKLRLYQGFDPTGTQLHIGHAVAFRKLREFQDLGHHVIFLIGDGTGQAGDPSGKKKTREHFFTRDELKKNALDYVKQAGKIVRFDGENPVEILFNGDWLNELKLVDILSIAENFSAQQFLERDMYQERIKVNESINLREFMYPLLQGYDSVAMNVDLEVGGTDQTFNMLIGRTLVERMLHKEKFVLTIPLLADAKGVKIGKSEGNVIGITDPANDFYAKILSLGDSTIIPCFSLLTDATSQEIETMKKTLESGENPMMFKKKLAFELTKQFNNEQSAKDAQETFERVVQHKEVPSEMETFVTGQKEWNIVDLLVTSNLVTSKGEGKRMVEQKAVEINGQLIAEHTNFFPVKNGDIIKVGKRRFIKVKVS